MGGNDTGKYTPAALDFMSYYHVFGLDGDHYTACTRVDKYPNGAPSCDVEGSMFEAYAHLRTKNPAQKFLYYQNSMFDFSHYNLHRQMEVRATAPVIQCGTRVLVPLLDSLMFGRVLK